MASLNLPNNKILVVDEDMESVLSIKGHLESAGFVVVSVRDEKTAFAAAEREEPDLILLDPAMAGKGGEQILRSLKKDVGMKWIPIMIICRVNDAEAKAALLDAGADDYLAKPFHIRELLSRVSALLRRSGGVLKKKRFGVQSIQYLIKRLESRRYQIHSTLVPGYSTPPLSWKGPLPDLLAERQGKRIAVSLEGGEALLAPMTLERWNAFLGNMGVELIVVVDSNISKRVAEIVRKTHGLKFRIVLEEERGKMDKFLQSKIQFRRYFFTRWISLAGLCVFFALLFSITVKFFPKAFDAVAQGIIINLAFYQPKDDERLLKDVEDIPEKWKKQLKESLSKIVK